MRNLIVVLLMLGCFAMDAQIKTPSASPSSKVMQTVGLTDVTVEYSRPGKKGRDIFSADGLVPHGAIWRTGANSATKISFSEDVMVNGADLKKGSYAILTVPSATSWKVNFYPYESTSWGSYREKDPAASVTATPTMMSRSKETFTIAVDDLKADGATINIYWDKTRVPLDLKVHTDKQAMASIDRVLAGPSKGDYYNIANYYHANGKDLNKALEYINIATAGENPRFWQVRRKALILADMGKVKEAIATAKKSLELAKAAGNNDYVRMNEASIAKWMKK